MAGVNKVILLGHLGQDPEVRHLDNGAVVAKLSLATTETYKDRSGERVSNTEWHTLELWEGIAKVAEQYLKKGSQIYVEGKIKTEQWEDENGDKKRAVKIRVQNLTMLGGSGSEQTKRPESSNPESKNNDQTEDELPF